LATLKLAEVAFDHLPDGVFNVLTGGAKVGEDLVRHLDIRVIAFTGSTEVGKRIAMIDVNHEMVCMREETFGPPIPIMGYQNFDEAIDLVNDSDYGLGACLRTNDARLAKRFFEEVKAGTIWINDPLTDHYGGPFGGMKMSGNARELGEEGLESFLETKHVHWDFDDGVKDFWYPYGK
jgi:acyl-CoA reductase-like NAD-dependent aldehyde dehydrogenase